MEIFETLLVVAISTLSSALVTYVIGKRLIFGLGDYLIGEIEAYISDENGQKNIAVLGMLFGKGIQAGLGLKGSLKGKKLFGLPPELWQPLAGIVFKKLGVNIGGEETPISSKGDSSSVKTKFDT